MNYFTNLEHRFLLAALDRERKICEEIDKERGGEPNLVHIVDGIKQKIQKIQYQKEED